MCCPVGLGLMGATPSQTGGYSYAPCALHWPVLLVWKKPNWQWDVKLCLSLCRFTSEKTGISKFYNSWYCDIAIYFDHYNYMMTQLCGDIHSGVPLLTWYEGWGVIPSCIMNKNTIIISLSWIWQSSMVHVLLRQVGAPKKPLLAPLDTINHLCSIPKRMAHKSLLITAPTCWEGRLWGLRKLWLYHDWWSTLLIFFNVVWWGWRVLYSAPFRVSGFLFRWNICQVGGLPWNICLLNRKVYHHDDIRYFPSGHFRVQRWKRVSF